MDTKLKSFKINSFITAFILIAAIFVFPAYGEDISLSAHTGSDSYFAVTLKDGTPLIINKGWVLVPESEDNIVISGSPECKVRDKYNADRNYEKPEGSDGYTINVYDAKLDAGKLQDFLKILSMRRTVSENKSDEYGDFSIYETGTYSYLTVEDKNNSFNLVVCWQTGTAGLDSIEAKGADFYTPFELSNGEHSLVMGKNASEAEIIFVPDKSVNNIYLQDENKEIIKNAIIQKGKNYCFKVKKSEFKEKLVLIRNIVLETKEGKKSTISFKINKRVDNIDSPDKITDYLCVGSQYSDGGNQLTGVYGLYPEKTLMGYGYWWSPISLGNFGGYVTYYYENAIEDNPKNPYGIDFIVYGNSNGGSGFSEPGNVLVSENGNDWYTLAGSEHYENRTQWNYEVVYSKKGNYTKAGNMDLKYWFPSKRSYPMYNWTDEEKITVNGVSIGNGIEACYPAFGYADVRTNSSVSWGTGEQANIVGKAKNPYLKITKKAGIEGPEDMSEIYEGAGDCYDLAWAVNEEGLPIKLSKVHYIKVQTATPPKALYNGIGEKSTEVNVIARSVPSGKDVGISKAPSKIVIGENELDLKDGLYMYSIDIDGTFDVSVEASDGSNIYINNSRGSIRSFPVSPNKRILRIIVQDGEKAPLIYYIKINHTPLTKEYIGKTVDNFTSGEEAVKRGEIISVMYDLSGRPSADAEQMYKDYEDSVKWAVGMGFINGYAGDLYLDMEITREQLSLLLYLYSDYFGTGFAVSSDINKYNDYTDIASWAQTSMNWAVGSGYIDNTEESTLNPKGLVTKSELNEILYRLFNGSII